MRILVTGESGYIAKHLIPHLAERHDVWSTTRRFSRTGDNTIYGDLLSEISVEEIYDVAEPDAVIHLAGDPLVAVDKVEPNYKLRNNICTTHNLLYYAPKGIKFVFASSILVYSNYKSGTSHYTESNTCFPSSVYGVSKYAAEQLGYVYAQERDLKVINLRLCATVGAGASHGCLPDFVKKLKSDSPTFDLIGDCPGSIKPYCHVSDVIRAFEFAVNLGASSTFNVCPNDNLSIQKIAEIARDEMGIYKPIKWLGESHNWAGDTKQILTSNHKIRFCGFDFKYRTSEDAIRQAVRDLNEKDKG